MPFIYKNGKRYSGTNNVAGDIVYDNTESGLVASSVQSAIDYLATNGSVAAAITISQEDFDKLTEEEKANGIYVIPDGEDLTAKNLFYDGSETGLGNTVQDAIDNQNKKLGDVINVPISPNPEALNGKLINYKKIGKVVFVNGYINSKMTGTSLYLVGVDPLGCPLEERVLFTLSGIGISTYGEVKNDGQILFNIPNEALNVNLIFNFAYIAKE